MEKSGMDRVHHLQNALSEARLAHWREEIFLSWQWWLLVVGTACVILIWLLLLDRTRLMPVLLNGGIASIACMTADTIGGELQLWEYPRMVLPWGPRIFCIDWIIAVSSMLLYQYLREWRRFLPWIVGMAALFAFVLEPLAQWIDIYRPIAWRLWYSFPIYIFLMCGFKAAADGLVRVQENSRRQREKNGPAEPDGPLPAS